MATSTLSRSKRPPTVTQLSSARYRHHWPFRCCSSPEPGGRQHGYTAAVRSPAAWVRARLAAWLGPDGAPLPSPGQQRAAAAARARADTAARLEEAARLEAGRTADTRGWAGRARAMLAARGGIVARDLARWQARTAAARPARPP